MVLACLARSVVASGCRPHATWREVVALPRVSNNFARQQFIGQSRTEPFNDPILPQHAWGHLPRGDSAFLAPIVDQVRNEFPSIVTVSTF